MTSLLALIKTYAVGTQKNCLTEMILLSTHNSCFGGKKKRVLGQVKCSERVILIYTYKYYRYLNSISNKKNKPFDMSWLLVSPLQNIGVKEIKRKQKYLYVKSFRNS